MRVAPPRPCWDLEQEEASVRQGRARRAARAGAQVAPDLEHKEKERGRQYRQAMTAKSEDSLVAMRGTQVSNRHRSANRPLHVLWRFVRVQLFTCVHARARARSM